MADPLAAPIDLDDLAAAALLPARDPHGHKGTFGSLGIVAGSLDYAGAALLTGSAALRTGCGVVTLYLPLTLQPQLAARVPELITRGLPETVARDGVDAVAAVRQVIAQAHDALVIGPGLPSDAGTRGMVEGLLRASGPAAVLDAGAFDALAEWPGWAEQVARRCVLTPHPGELRRLGSEPGTRDAERAHAAAAVAAQWRQVVVLKGAGTIVAEPRGRLWRASAAVPALATAGSGDVLAGVIGSLLAQGLPPFEAAALGVYLHARAGEAASAELGNAGVIASDLLGQLPRVRHRLDARPAERLPAAGAGDSA
jgi:NAD(P)H-hydrate epimerase